MKELTTESILKKLKINYLISIIIFTVLSSIAIFLKTQKLIADQIEMSNKLVTIVPIVMMITIIISYIIYDRMAKSSKKTEDENKRLKKFYVSSLTKSIMFSFVGYLIIAMILLIYQKTYIYMLGIVFVFYIINYPKELHYKKFFDNDENAFFDK